MWIRIGHGKVSHFMPNGHSACGMLMVGWEKIPGQIQAEKPCKMCLVKLGKIRMNSLRGLKWPETRQKPEKGQ